MHSFDHDKSSSISNREISKNYLNILMEPQPTSASNILLLFGVLPINFELYSKDLLVIVLLLFILLQAALFSFASSFTSSL